jgi:hypothetical protein
MDEWMNDILGSRAPWYMRWPYLQSVWFQFSIAQPLPLPPILFDTPCFPPSCRRRHPDTFRTLRHWTVSGMSVPPLTMTDSEEPFTAELRYCSAVSDVDMLRSSLIHSFHPSPFTVYHQIAAYWALARLYCIFTYTYVTCFGRALAVFREYVWRGWNIILNSVTKHVRCSGVFWILLRCMCGVLMHLSQEYI